MLATKDFQKSAAQDVEKLKIEKNTLIKRRVRLHLLALLSSLKN